jgi:hypothetical protein
MRRPSFCPFFRFSCKQLILLSLFVISGSPEGFPRVKKSYRRFEIQFDSTLPIGKYALRQQMVLGIWERGNMNKRVLALLSGVALAGAFGCNANADVLTLGLQETGFNSGKITVESTTSGTFVFSGLYGTFNINLITAQDFVALGGFDLLNSNTQNTSTTKAGTLSVYVTAQGITGPLGRPDFLSSFTVNSLPKGWTVTENTFLDPANGLYNAGQTANTGTLLASHVFTSGAFVGPIDTLSPFFLTGPFSVTEQYIIHATGKGSDNSTIDIAAVPEPSTWAMLMLGFGGLGLMYGRRTRRRPATT